MKARADALAVVQAVMGRVFGVPPGSITEATKPGDVERWDSLNMVIVAVGLERRLDRPIAVETCLAATSVAALLDAVCAGCEATHVR